MSIINNKYHCPCGSIITNKKSNINGHNNTKKHKIYENHKPDHTYLPQEIQNIIIGYANDYTDEWTEIRNQIIKCYSSIVGTINEPYNIKYMDMKSIYIYNVRKVSEQLQDVIIRSKQPIVGSRDDMFWCLYQKGRDVYQKYNTMSDQIADIYKKIFKLFELIDNIPTWHNMDTNTKYLPKDIRKYRNSLDRNYNRVRYWTTDDYLNKGYISKNKLKI